MPEYLSPGVYIEELSTGPVPIEGVSTSTAGFVGQTERGPTTVMLVTSFTEYQRWFGSFIDTTVSFLPFAVKGFFDNGGQRVFIARVVGAGALPSSLPIPGSNLTATAIGPGPWGNNIFLRVKESSIQRAGAPIGFRLTILYFAVPPPTPLVDPLDPRLLRDPNRRDPDVVEDYDNLRIDPRSQDFPLTAVNAVSHLIQLALSAAGDVTLPPPMDLTVMAGGAEATAATDVEYIGGTTADLAPDKRLGLEALKTVDDISLVCVPDEVLFPNVTPEIVTQCERRKDRFAILQVPFGQGLVNSIHPPLDSSYAAIYSPWIRIFNQATREYPLIPPGGHIAGIYANTDVDRGVHKAPANYEIAGIVTRDIDSNRKPLEFAFTKGEHDILNPRGVNVIRDFRSHGRGIRVFGARTMSTDSQWKYINVRRLFIFVEQSVERGTQWVVFEPNDEPTWARVRRSLTNFLISVWRSGALMGATAEEAFFVKCDRTTMTQDDIDNGRLICLVGIAPVKPAEFVIFRFSQKTIETQP
jgi:uncharacterized protein